MDNFVDDDTRCDHFISTLAKKNHPFSSFSWGNFKSLVELPKSNNIDVRAKMVEFFNKHYKASRMSLVIQSQESLDSVEKLVRKYFKDLPTEVNNELTPEQIKEDELIKDLLSNTNVFARKDYPFEEETMNKLYVMDSIEDGHTLKLIYCFPPVMHLYKLKPLHTLSSILGYEGSNSLIRYLFKKKLILEFLTSQDECCNFHTSKYHSLLCLTIKLTDDGLEKVDLVVRLINYYINLMNKKGPQVNYFNEERLMSLTNILFEDEISSLGNVIDLSKQLFMYPLEYAIIGPKLLYDFNQDVVKYCLDFIKTQPKLAVIQSKKAFKHSNWAVEQDFWSDIQFKIEPLPKNWSVNLIENEELISSLKIPLPNEFIPKDFALKKLECYYEHPILIDEDTNYRCYFKNDKKFQTPKACIYLIWQSDYLRQNQEALVSLKFYVKYFLLMIIEHVYPAEVASLAYSLNATKQGLELQVNGFNDKLYKLLKLILDELTSFNIDSTLFDTIKLETVRDYYNLLISNDDLVQNILAKSLMANHQLYTQQREVIKKMDILQITGHVLNFFTTSYCQCLIEGNYTRKEAQTIFDYVKLTSDSMKEEVNLEVIKKSHILQMPVGTNYCYVKSFNKMDENILVLNNYQLGILNEEEIVMLDLVMQEMSDPLFNLLRNEQTLAYCLYCRYSKSLNNVCSYQIFIKSLADKFTPLHVDEQVEWFIDHFLQENILKMNETHFNEIKEARIKHKQVPFVSLRKEANWFWSEISMYSYRFNRKNEEIEILKNVSGLFIYLITIYLI